MDNSKLTKAIRVLDLARKLFVNDPSNVNFVTMERAMLAYQAVYNSKYGQVEDMDRFLDEACELVAKGLENISMYRAKGNGNHSWLRR